MENFKQKYNTALETARKINSGEGVAAPKDWSIPEVIFPELRKEFIKEELIQFLETCRDPRFVGNMKREEWIAWLEKQSDISPTKDELEALRIAAYEPTKNWSEKLQSLHEKLTHYKQISNDKHEEKQEQKPTNKEPKFKTGDWIISSGGMLKHIVNVDKTGYQTDNGWLSHDTLEMGFHLWTIEDAKDGDVLHSTGWNNDCIFIFKGIDRWIFDETNRDRVVATGYCCLFVSSDKMELGLQGPDCIEVNTIKPATKIQRDLLFSKMEEARYEWDVEKKELKKIESKSSWSEEDENTFISLCSKLPFMVEHCYLEDVTKYIFWLETLKQRLTWNANIHAFPKKKDK